MSSKLNHAEAFAPRLLPALVVLAALIVLAGLVSLHAAAIEPAGADISHLL